MDYGFQGRVALVTGTASQVGMGNAICLTLAKEGCDVVSADMDFDGANQTALAVRTLGREALALKVDVAKSFEVDEMTKIILKKFLFLIPFTLFLTTFNAHRACLKTFRFRLKMTQLKILRFVFFMD